MSARSRPDDRLAGEVDLVLQLLDRQVVDREGRMVGKVDDVELREGPDGLLVTGLLLGPAVLLPRLSERGARLWRAMAPEQSDRGVPHVIGLDRVARLGSGVELDRDRAGVARPQEQGAGVRGLHRLTRMPVLRDGEQVGHVLDVRAAARPGPGRRLVVTHVLVGRGRPGSFLGYDRRGDQGPWVVDRVVRRLHRHSAIAEAGQVDIDWDDGVVRVRGELRPLR